MKLSHNKVSQARQAKGNTILELPIALWISLIVFFVPMMGLASITMRCSLLNIAVLEAVHAAAKARTFEQASDEGPSAKDLAQTSFTKFVTSFPGLGANTVKLCILATQVNTGVLTKTEGKLTQPADSSAFLYQIESSASGSIEPVFSMSKDIFGDVPGLTAPMKVSFKAREMVENPPGLNR